jgi:hypothetical protein
MNRVERFCVGLKNRSQREQSGSRIPDLRVGAVVVLDGVVVIDTKSERSELELDPGVAAGSRVPALQC